MLNKTLKGTGKKTKWAHKVAITALGFGLLLSFLAAFSFEEIKAPPADNQAPPISPKKCEGLTAEGICYTLERADTNQSRIKGLSDRSELKPQTGMLFVFDAPSKECIWMKDMHFNLDIVWLDEAKKVTKIEQDVSPATYPNSFCSDNTKYVIELNSGDVTKLKLETGNKLMF